MKEKPYRYEDVQPEHGEFVFWYIPGFDDNPLKCWVPGSYDEDDGIVSNEDNIEECVSHWIRPDNPTIAPTDDLDPFNYEGTGGGWKYKDKENVK